VDAWDLTPEQLEAHSAFTCDWCGFGNRLHGCHDRWCGYHKMRWSVPRVTARDHASQRRKQAPPFEPRYSSLDKALNDPVDDIGYEVVRTRETPMPEITNGSITFERTRKTADYEGKKASVTLSFTLALGEDPGLACSHVGLLATNHALLMVGEQPTNAPEVSGSMAKRQRVTPPEVKADPFVASGETAPTTVATAAELVDAPAPEITNADLTSAITAVVKAHPDKTEAIMQLVVSYTGDRLKKIYEVTDQAKRAEFLAKLAAL
jgi:hypothetical protein